MKLEFATTACVRPELLEITYSSLQDVLVDVDTEKEGKLYINIDPVPQSSEEKIKKEIDVAKSFFNEVVYNIGPEKGNFPKAASWVLNQPEGEYFFHCEDDWRFYGGEICIQEYIEMMKEDERDNMLQCVTHNNGGGNRVHFPPSLYQTDVLQNILEEYPIPYDGPDRIVKDPEQWIKHLKFSGKVDYNVVSHPDIERKDLGREWLKKRGIKKDKFSGHCAAFDKWDFSNYNG